MYTLDDIAVYIFNWKKVSTNSLLLYNNIIKVIKNTTIINCDETLILDSSIKHIQLDDSHYYGSQYEHSIKDVKIGSIFCTIVGDIIINDVEILFNKALNTFNTIRTGIYSPNDLRTPHTTLYENINGSLYNVPNTDCGLWFIHPSVILKMKNLKYSISKYGWGIDIFTICEARKHDLFVLRDMSIEVDQLTHEQNYPSNMADAGIKLLEYEYNKLYTINPSVLTVYKSPFPKIRLGKDFDGGYIICEIPNINYSILLSGGIEHDVSFEEDFVNKYVNVQCFAFDGTIQKLPKKHDNIFFIKKNIGFKNNEHTTNLHAFINDNDSIFVKMDIEGGEIPWIQSLNNEQLNKFEQIVIEFHNPFLEVEVFNKLNKNHYLIHFHGNNCCGVRNHCDVIIPNIFECTYLHKKYFTDIPKLNTDLIPGTLDMKNMEYHNEIIINYPPFVN